MPRSPRPGLKIEREERSLRNRLDKAQRQRTDTRLRPLVQRAAAGLEYNDAQTASALGVPHRTYAAWMTGVILPSKYVPGVESWLSRQGVAV